MTAVEFSYWMFAVVLKIIGFRWRKQVPAHHALGTSSPRPIITILFRQNHCESRVGIENVEIEYFSIYLA